MKYMCGLLYMKIKSSRPLSFIVKQMTSIEAEVYIVCMIDQGKFLI